jgi:hypothetical protein
MPESEHGDVGSTPADKQLQALGLPRAINSLMLRVINIRIKTPL